VITRDTITRPLTAIWLLAVSLATALSQPRTDVEASDAAFEGLLRESAIARCAGMAGRAVGAAWHHSRTRALFGRSASEIGAMNREAAIRAASWTLVVASATALVLNAIKPTPAGPFSWLLPAVCGAASLIALLAAGSLARALGDRRS
jgi:alkylation response protein AidB-like acyl-CoA dehydrogenase